MLQICKAHRDKMRDRGQFSRPPLPDTGLALLEGVTRLRLPSRGVLGRGGDGEDDDEDDEVRPQHWRARTSMDSRAAVD